MSKGSVYIYNNKFLATNDIKEVTSFPTLKVYDWYLTEAEDEIMNTIKLNNINYVLKDNIQYTNLSYYARNNIPNYSKITSLSQDTINNLTNITADKSAAGVFADCKKLTSIPKSLFSTWNMDHVETISSMFAYCSELTSIDLSELNIGKKIKSIGGLFLECSNLKEIKGIFNWDTSNITKMNGMFWGCYRFTQPLDLSNWNTSKVENMNYMFNNCHSTSINVSNFDTSNVTEMGKMFEGCREVTALDVSNFNISKVKDLEKMFKNCANLQYLDVSNWDTSNITNISEIFSGCKALTLIDGIENIDTRNLKWMNDAFKNCAMSSLDLSNWNTDNLESINSAFSNSQIESINLSGWNVTKLDNNENGSNAGSLNGLFSGCDKLKTIDLTGWDTSNAMRTAYMFSGCKSLTSLDLSNLDVSNVVYMSGMFDGCTSLSSLNLSGWNTKNVKYMDNMFFYCTSLPQEFPYIIDCDSIEDKYGLDQMFLYTPVTKVKFKNLMKNIKQEILEDPTILKGEKSHYTSGTGITYAPLTVEFVDDYDIQLDNTMQYQMRELYPDIYSTMTSLPDNIDIRALTNTYAMFKGCTNLSGIDTFNTISMIQGQEMFFGCKSLPNEVTINFKSVEVNPEFIESLEYSFQNMFEDSSVQTVYIKNGINIIDTIFMAQNMAQGTEQEGQSYEKRYLFMPPEQYLSSIFAQSSYINVQFIG